MLETCSIYRTEKRCLGEEEEEEEEERVT